MSLLELRRHWLIELKGGAQAALRSSEAAAVGLPTGILQCLDMFALRYYYLPRADDKAIVEASDFQQLSSNEMNRTGDPLR